MLAFICKIEEKRTLVCCEKHEILDETISTLLCVRFEDVSTISTAPTTVTIDPAYTDDITVTVRSRIVFLSQFR